MAKCTTREVQATSLAKQCRERKGLMSSRDAYVMIHHGMIEDCPVSTHDIFRETAIWNKLLGNLKGKETRRSPEEIKVEHVSLGVHTELMLHKGKLERSPRNKGDHYERPEVPRNRQIHQSAQVP